MDQVSYLCACDNVIQAHLLKSLLEDYEIQVTVHVPIDLEIGHPHLLVHSADYDLAAGIADAFHRHVVQAADDEGESPATDEWWRCERCNAPRITRCPDCEAEGSDFHIGYHLPTEDESADIRATAVCLNCDALFVAGVLEPCPACTTMGYPRSASSPALVTPLQVSILWWSGLIVAAALLWMWYQGG